MDRLRAAGAVLACALALTTAPHANAAEQAWSVQTARGLVSFSIADVLAVHERLSDNGHTERGFRGLEWRDQVIAVELYRHVRYDIVTGAPTTRGRCQEGDVECYEKVGPPDPVPETGVSPPPPPAPPSNPCYTHDTTLVAKSWLADKFGRTLVLWKFNQTVEFCADGIMVTPTPRNIFITAFYSDVLFPWTCVERQDEFPNGIPWSFYAPEPPSPVVDVQSHGRCHFGFSARDIEVAHERNPFIWNKYRGDASVVYVKSAG